MELTAPGIPIKEYQIATEVLGRSTDFDPQLDSMVRVQAGRLRVKLTEYYGTDGAGDPDQGIPDSDRGLRALDGFRPPTGFDGPRPSRASSRKAHRVLWN